MDPLCSLRSESLSHCEGAGTGARLTGVNRLRVQILLLRTARLAGWWLAVKFYDG